MRILIPAGAIAALLWLVSRPEWEHASHGKKVAAILGLAAAFAVLEILAAVARSRKPKSKQRPGLYASSGRR